MRVSLFIIAIISLSSCASIIMPSGGEKDTLPPSLIKIEPINKSINFKANKIIFEFNENIQENQWNKHFNISPLTNKPVRFKINNTQLTVFLDDLKKETTYSISLNNCIKDLNEGNILEDLNYTFSTSNKIDSLKLNGNVIDAKTLSPIINEWVFLQNKNLEDSLCFAKKPIYATKTNKNGEFLFNNLTNVDYKLLAISGIDFAYQEKDKIGFLQKNINAIKDSNITLLLFDPLHTSKIQQDSTKNQVASSDLNGEIRIQCNLDMKIILQLYQKDKLIQEASFNKAPYVLKDVSPGIYEVFLIVDANKNNLWDTGDFYSKKIPEKIYKYAEEINLRANWITELDWPINEL